MLWFSEYLAFSYLLQAQKGRLPHIRQAACDLSDLVRVWTMRSCSRSALSYMRARKYCPGNQCWTEDARYIFFVPKQIETSSVLISFPGRGPNICAYYSMEKTDCKYTCSIISAARQIDSRSRFAVSPKGRHCTQQIT